MTLNVAVANLSPWRQSRWCSIPMPCSEAAALPQHCLIDGRWLATRGQRLGDHTQMWHAHLDLEGHASGPLLEWRGIPTFPAFTMSPWLAEDPRKAEIRVLVTIDGVIRGMQLVYAATEFDGIACKVWRLEAHYEGWHAWCYATIWSGQDVVDLALRVVWSDPQSTKCRLTERCTIEIGSGEPLHGWGPDAGRVIAPCAVRIYEGPAIHGYPIDWRGVLGALPDAGLHGANERRLANIWAARGGPIVGDAVWPEGEWLALGVVPFCTHAANLQQQWVEYSSRQRSYHRERPLGLHLYAGGAGDQPPYGSTKCGEVANGRPWRVPMLLDAASDPRAIFHCNRGGAPVTMQTHPGLLTWEGLIDLRNSSDTLGKDREQPAGWSSVEGRQVQVDDQHHGNLYRVAAYAVTGDYLVRDYLLAELRVEESRAFANLWQDSNATSWLDAPRAEGRLMLGNASKALLLPETRPLVLRLADRSMRQRDAAIPKTGEVRPAFTLVHGSVLPDDQLATMPWHGAIFCAGLLAHYYAMLELGHNEQAARALELAIRVGRDVVQWGSVRSAWGQWLPITGLKILPGGAANPPSYYTFPRAGASTTGLFAPGDDMLVGSAGWWSWYAGALAATLHGPRDEIYDRAREIWNVNAPSRSIAWSEWFAIPIPEAG